MNIFVKILQAGKNITPSFTRASIKKNIYFIPYRHTSFFINDFVSTSQEEKKSKHEQYSSEDSKSKNPDWKRILINGRSILPGAVAASISSPNEDEERDKLQELIKAAQEGKLDVIEKYFSDKKNKAGVYQKIHDLQGNTLLLIAAINGHLNVAKWFIENCNAQLTEQNKEGRTALLLATGEGHYEFVKWLLEQDQSLIKHSDGEGNTALLCAARLKRSIKSKDSEQKTVKRNVARELVELLHTNGAQLTEQNKEGITTLFLAAAKGNEALVEWLLSKDQSLIKHRDYEGNTVLLYAVVNDQKNIVKLLLDKGADIREKNIMGNTALHLSYYYLIDADLNKFLIEKGAEEDALNIYKLTPKGMSNQSKAMRDTMLEFEKMKSESDKSKQESEESKKALDKSKKELDELKEEDTQAASDAFRKILNEKINVTVYADKAVHEGLLIPQETSFEKTAARAFEIGQLASTLSDDVRLRIGATLIMRITNDGIEGYKQYRDSGKTKYVEKFNHVFICDATREASQMIANRYKKQLAVMTPEGMESLAKYFEDKLITGLRESFEKEEKCRAACNTNISSYVYTPMWSISAPMWIMYKIMYGPAQVTCWLQGIPGAKTTPIVKEMYNIMISPGGESIPIELRGRSNTTRNLDVDSNWDTKELIEKTGVLVKDESLPEEDKHGFYVKKAPVRNPKNPKEYQYDFCYGEKEKIQYSSNGKHFLLAPYMPLEHLHVIKKDLKNSDESNYLCLRTSPNEQSHTTEIVLHVKKDEKYESKEKLELVSKKIQKLIESSLFINDGHYYENNSAIPNGLKQLGINVQANEVTEVNVNLGSKNDVHYEVIISISKLGEGNEEANSKFLTLNSKLKQTLDPEPSRNVTNAHQDNNTNKISP